MHSKSPPNRALSPTCLHCDITHLSLMTGIVALHIPSWRVRECSIYALRHIGCHGWQLQLVASSKTESKNCAISWNVWKIVSFFFKVWSKNFHTSTRILMGKWTWTNDTNKHKHHDSNSVNFLMIVELKEIMKFAITSHVSYIQITTKEINFELFIYGLSNFLFYRYDGFHPYIANVP